MSIPKIAAIIALIGIVGLVASSLAHAGAWGDVIFNASAVCLIVAPPFFLAGSFSKSYREVAK